MINPGRMWSRPAASLQQPRLGARLEAAVAATAADARRLAQRIWWPFEVASDLTALWARGSDRDMPPYIAERNGSAKRYLNFGASPRASLALYQAGRALAWLRGHDYLSPALVQDLAPDVMRHRIGLTYEAEAEEITPDKIIAQVIERTPVPAK